MCIRDRRNALALGGEVRRGDAELDLVEPEVAVLTVGPVSYTHLIPFEHHAELFTGEVFPQFEVTVCIPPQKVVFQRPVHSVLRPCGGGVVQGLSLIHICSGRSICVPRTNAAFLPSS